MTLTIIMFSHDVDHDDDVDVNVEHDAPLIVLASKVLRWLRKKVRRVSFSFFATHFLRFFVFYFLLLPFSFHLLWSHLKWRVYTLTNSERAPNERQETTLTDPQPHPTTH